MQGMGIGWLAGNPIRQRMASNRLRDGEGGWKHWWGRANLVSIVGESDKVLGVGGLGPSQHSLFLPRSSGHRHNAASHSSRSALPLLATVFSVGLGVRSWVCLQGSEWKDHLLGWSPLVWESARLGSKLHPQHLTDCTILDNNPTSLSPGFPAVK